jgi:hypothetical protein
LVVLEQAYGTIVSGEGFGAAPTAEDKTDALAAIVDRQHRRGTSLEILRGAWGFCISVASTTDTQFLRAPATRRGSVVHGVSCSLGPLGVLFGAPLFEHAETSGNTVITSFGAMLNRLLALISTIWLSSRTTISLRLSSPALM